MAVFRSFSIEGRPTGYDLKEFLNPFPPAEGRRDSVASAASIASTHSLGSTSSLCSPKAPATPVESSGEDFMVMEDPFMQHGALLQQQDGLPLPFRGIPSKHHYPMPLSDSAWPAYMDQTEPDGTVNSRIHRPTGTSEYEQSYHVAGHLGSAFSSSVSSSPQSQSHLSGDLFPSHVSWGAASHGLPPIYSTVNAQLYPTYLSSFGSDTATDGSSWESLPSSASNFELPTSTIIPSQTVVDSDPDSYSFVSPRAFDSVGSTAGASAYDSCRLTPFCSTGPADSSSCDFSSPIDVKPSISTCVSLKPRINDAASRLNTLKTIKRERRTYKTAKRKSKNLPESSVFHGDVEVRLQGKFRHDVNGLLRPESSEKEKRFQCNHAASEGGGLCDRRFRRPEHLKRHVRTHQNRKDYPCAICDKALDRSDNLGAHYVTHVEIEGKKGRNKTQTLDGVEQEIRDYHSSEEAEKYIIKLRKDVDKTLQKHGLGPSSRDGSK